MFFKERNMKRHGNLFGKWCNYQTLLKAYSEVKKRKTNYYTFINFERKLAVNLERILNDLQTGSYKVKPYRTFKIQDPKERIIQAPNLEDRIVQHAVLNIVRPIVEKRFIADTYACIKEKGTHSASNRLVKFLQQYKDEGYCLKIDIEKYFYRIDHKVLKLQLERIIKCKDTLRILYMFIENEEDIGLPLGNVTSQLLANLALSPLDHFIKRELKAKHYIRYMDDMIILHKCKNYLRRCLAEIKEFIISLKLKTNSKTKIAKIRQGIDFVGYRTWWNYRLIRKRSIKRFLNALKENADRQVLQSFFAHAKYTLSTNKLKQYELLYI